MEPLLCFLFRQKRNDVHWLCHPHGHTVSNDETKTHTKVSKNAKGKCKTVMDYISKNHSKYLIMVHLSFVCKYRKHLLVPFGIQIKQLMFDIAEENDFGIIEMEVDKDHVHLLVQYNPTQSILEIVRLLKQISTYRLWRTNDNHLHLQKHFWKERTFWSDGYFACSIGNVSKEIIEKYIQNQG